MRAHDRSTATIDRPAMPSKDVAADSQEEAMQSLERESGSLWKEHPIAAFVTLTVPLWLSAAILVAAFVWQGFALVKQLVLATMASAAAGRFIIWTGTSAEHGLGFSAWQLALLVLYLDTIWAIVLTWHAGFLFHVPWLGVRVKAAVEEGNALLKSNRWIRRVTVLGVMLFVMLPISSTGSIGGSLLGRLLGLSRAGTFITVVAGSLIGGGLMLAGAEALAPWFQSIGPAGTYGSIAVLVLVGFVISRRYRRSITD